VALSKQETSHCAFTKSEVHLIAFKSERDATIIKVFVVAKKKILKLHTGTGQTEMTEQAGQKDK